MKSRNAGSPRRMKLSQRGLQCQQVRAPKPASPKGWQQLSEATHFSDLRKDMVSACDVCY